MDSTENTPEQSSEQKIYCYFHPGTIADYHCVNCGKPICTADITTTSQGIRCPLCVEEVEETSYFRAVFMGILMTLLGILLLTLVPYCGRFPLLIIVGYSIGWAVGWGSRYSRSALLPVMSAALTALAFVGSGYLAYKDPILLLFGAVGLLASIIATRY